MSEIDFQALSRRLYAAVLSDVLDEMGYPHQAMRPFVRPLDDTSVVFGLARTGLYMLRFSVEPDENPYEVEMALIDDLEPGDVPVLACDGPTDTVAPWGELLTTAARMRGAAGCVTDGLVRDVRQIRETGFPVFHGGIGPLDTKGRAKMMEMDVPVRCGGALVAPGDLIFADVDGVVVIPGGVADAAIRAALAKIDGEDATRDALLGGALLKDVYEKYKIL